MSTPSEHLDFTDDRVEADDDATLDVTTAPASTDESSDEERDRASRMGWSDKEHFRGDPERWVTAKQFLEKGETMLPVLKERLRKQDQDLMGMRQELHKVVQTQGEFERQTRERIEAEFNERKRKAVEEADTDAYDKAHQDEAKWRQEAQTQPAAQPGAAPTGQADVDPIYQSWEDANPWVKTDTELAEFANDIGAVIATRQPHLRGTATLLDQVAQRVKKAYPDKFTNPNRGGKPDLEGGAGPTSGGNTGRKQGYGDLPSAAKAKCDQYVAQGWVKSREEYCTTYFGEES